jgi:hypothetical protein
VKILDDPVQKNVTDQLAAALQPFAKVALAIRDRTMTLVPVPPEAVQAHASCLRLVDTFYDEYLGKIPNASIKISVGRGGDKRTAALDLSEACLAPYFATVSLAAKDLLEDGKVVETGDLLEAAAPVVAATRSLESRGAALPEESAAKAYATQAAEAARLKLRSQLEKAGLKMPSSLKKLAAIIKTTLEEMRECTQCFADFKDAAQVRCSEAMLLKFCDSPGAKAIYEQMCKLDNIESEQEMLVSRVQEAFSADPAAASQFKEVIERVQAKFGEVRGAELATFSAAGQLLGNLTASQALMRKLSEFESRAALAKKALKGLRRRRYLSAQPLLKQMLEEAAPSAGALAASPQQPAQS